MISEMVDRGFEARSAGRRLVRMPTSRPSLAPSWVIGTPEMRYFLHGSERFICGWPVRAVIGFTLSAPRTLDRSPPSDACSSEMRQVPCG